MPNRNVLVSLCARAMQVRDPNQERKLSGRVQTSISPTQLIMCGPKAAGSMPLPPPSRFMGNCAAEHMFTESLLEARYTVPPDGFPDGGDTQGDDSTITLPWMPTAFPPANIVLCDTESGFTVDQFTKLGDGEDGEHAQPTSPS